MIVLFYGVPGAGKTTAMQAYVAAHAHEYRFFIVDHVKEWDFLEDGKPNLRWKGVPQEFFHIVEPGTTLDTLQCEEAGLYLFQEPWESIQVAEMAVGVGNVTFCDDEIDFVATYKDWDANPIRRMVHRGRHCTNAQGDVCELHILGAARRAQSLHIDLSSMADQALIFRVQGHRTLKRLFDDSMLDEADMAEIVNFPNFEYVMWKSDGTRARGKVRNPFEKSKKKVKQEFEQPEGSQSSQDSES